MKIFLTGATGYIGGAVLEAAIREGHDVTALVRTAAKARAVEARGATAVLGDLAESASFAAAASGHAAYVHAGSESSARGVEVDRAAINTLLEHARAARDAVFIYTSGVWVLGNTAAPADESARLAPAEKAAFRPGHERLVLEARRDGLRTLVVRPGIVFGGASGIIGDLIREAHAGEIRVVGPGENRWPVIYRPDVGDLYVRLLNAPEVSGIVHAATDVDETVNVIAGAIASAIEPTPAIRHVALPEARAELGAYADALALDQVVRSPRARALGWTPSVDRISSNAARLVEEWRAASAGTSS